MFYASIRRQSVFSTLVTNSRLFPRFAAFVALSYLVVGFVIAAFVAHYTSVSNGVVVSSILLVLDAIASVVAFMVIASNPDLLSRCQRAADALVNYSGSSSVDEEPEPESDSYQDEYEEEDEEEENDEQEEPEVEEPKQDNPNPEEPEQHV